MLKQTFPVELPQISYTRNFKTLITEKLNFGLYISLKLSKILRNKWKL